MLKGRISPIVAVASLFAGLATTQVADAYSCKQVSGPFTSQFDTGPGCPDSPIGQCTHGVLQGDLAGTYEFSFHTMVPDPTVPGKFDYTGASVITLSQTGKIIYGNDTGSITFGGTTAFMTFVSIVGGTRNFANADGNLAASGTLDLVTGQATGTYSGAVCNK